MPTPCTVTGTLATLTSGKIAQGKVIFQLTNIGIGNPISVTGTSIFPSLTVTIMTAQDGTFTTQLWGNDNINPSNTLYSVTFRDFQGNEIGPVLYSITGSNANLNSLAATGTIIPPVFVTNAVVLNPSALQTITGFPLAAPAFQSPNANPASAGLVRLAVVDLVEWRNATNSGDLNFGVRSAVNGNVPANTLIFDSGGGNAFEAGAFIQNGNDASVATAGAVRLHTGDAVNWRNNANSGDIGLSKTTGDVLQYNATPVSLTIASGSGLALGTTLITSGASATTVTAAATGATTSDAIVWCFGPTGPPSAFLVVGAFITANNVNFLVTNPSAGSVTPGASTVNWRVVR